jgi:hypothetical protein
MRWAMPLPGPVRYRNVRAAQALVIPVDTIRSRLNRARRQLRPLVDDGDLISVGRTVGVEGHAAVAVGGRESGREGHRFAKVAGIAEEKTVTGTLE